MNAYENWVCGSAFWRYITRRQLLPWLLHGTELGDSVLELGAGRGAATLELAKIAPRVTSLEYDHKSLTILAERTNNSSARAIQGDASALPFASGSFSAVIAILMLHHLKSRELQNRAFAEVFRVLRPGGVFLAFDIPDGWFHRVAHIRSTFVPLDLATVGNRLSAAGFSRVAMNSGGGGFRIQALRPE